MILLIDAWETNCENNERIVNAAYAVFAELDNDGVHKIARLAVGRISDWLLKIGQRRDARLKESRRAAAGRQRSMHGPQRLQQPMKRPLQLSLDTAPMTTNVQMDTVMGNTGMFLLEDPGLQSFVQTSQTFQPLSWQMAGSTPITSPSIIQLPPIPVSQVTAQPFPVMSAPYMSAAIPATNAPYAVGLQPRMTSGPSRRKRTSAAARQPMVSGPYPSHSARSPPTSFTAINHGFG